MILTSDIIFLIVIIIAIPLAVFTAYVHIAYVQEHLKTKHYDKFFLILFALFVTFLLGVKFSFTQGRFLIVWLVLALMFYLDNLLARALLYKDVKKLLKEL